MKTSPLGQVREFYEQLADSYSTMMDQDIDLPVYADLLGRLVGRIAHIPGPLIDTSCGSGHMLARYHQRYGPDRSLVGVDLSPRMVAIATALLGPAAEIIVGDMRVLDRVPSDSSAAVLSFFSIQHLDPEEALVALREWHRVLSAGGQLLLAAWEGTGFIDYGDLTDVSALMYQKDEVVRLAQSAGFDVDRCVVEPFEGMSMNALYLEGTSSTRSLPL